MTPPTFLIATTNPGKLREIQEILSEFLNHQSGSISDWPFQLALPAQLGIHLDVAETGQTYADNAVLKARAFCEASGLVTLSDDSGLEVDALDGQPGLYSARYAPWPNATDADRRRYLLHNLGDKARPWVARFHCSFAIATPGGDVHITEGEVEGEVIDQERGSGGFGYDPVFLLPKHGLTMAELPAAEKNRMSHRARAIQVALPLLLELAG
jgi:XTP/dITP diphosphohydrolase